MLQKMYPKNMPAGRSDMIAVLEDHHVSLPPCTSACVMQQSPSSRVAWGEVQDSGVEAEGRAMHCSRQAARDEARLAQLACSGLLAMACSSVSPQQPKCPTETCLHGVRGAASQASQQSQLRPLQLLNFYLATAWLTACRAWGT